MGSRQKLCEKCQDVFDQWYLRESKEGLVPTKIHYSIDGLLLSAQTGCPVCNLHVNSLTSDEISQIRSSRGEKESSLIFWNPQNDEDRCFLHIDFDVNNEEEDFLPVAKLDVILGDCSDQSPEIPQVAPTTDCELTWARAAQWIEWCAPRELEESRSVEVPSNLLSEIDLDAEISSSNSERSEPEDGRGPKWLHDHNCHKLVTEKQLPTRLILVGSETADVRLCLPNSFPRSSEIKYVTLSHCWGTVSTRIGTTKQNMNQMLQRIPVESLTKTFQDAITITRRLGLRYLWIDSLCILQGDEEDWVNESAIMGRIYAGCFLNIVACDAPNGSVGCFFDRNVGEPRGFKVMARSEEDSEEMTLWNVMPHLFGYHSTSDSATSARAWCFQETFLAPRSLFFSKSQLFWECRQFRACESFPQGINVLRGPLRQTTSSWQHGLTRNIFAAWFDLVTEYSLGRLTYSKDKLVALSGIAKCYCNAFRLMHGDARDQTYHYLAGLWRQRMEQQLLWYVVSHRKPRHPALHAPSWSWASVDGLVFLPGDKDHYANVEIVVGDVTVNPCTKDQYGEVDGGTMKIRCKPLVPVSVNEKSELVIEGQRGSVISHSVVYPDHEPPDFGTTDLFALPSWELIFGEQWGLLLRLDAQPAQFRRVGVYKLDEVDGVDIKEGKFLLEVNANWISHEAGYFITIV